MPGVIRSTLHAPAPANPVHYARELPRQILCMFARDLPRLIPCTARKVPRQIPCTAGFRAPLNGKYPGKVRAPCCTAARNGGEGGWGSRGGGQAHPQQISGWTHSPHQNCRRSDGSHPRPCFSLPLPLQWALGPCTRAIVKTKTNCDVCIRISIVLSSWDPPRRVCSIGVLRKSDENA